jgi:hypothetical protein
MLERETAQEIHGFAEKRAIKAARRIGEHLKRGKARRFPEPVTAKQGAGMLRSAQDFEKQAKEALLNLHSTGRLYGRTRREVVRGRHAASEFPGGAKAYDEMVAKRAKAPRKPWRGEYTPPRDVVNQPEKAAVRIGDLVKMKKGGLVALSGNAKRLVESKWFTRQRLAADRKGMVLEVVPRGKKGNIHVIVRRRQFAAPETKGPSSKALEKVQEKLGPRREGEELAPIERLRREATLEARKQRLSRKRAAAGRKGGQARRGGEVPFTGLEKTAKGLGRVFGDPTTDPWSTTYKWFLWGNVLDQLYRTMGGIRKERKASKERRKQLAGAR